MYIPNPSIDRPRSCKKKTFFTLLLFTIFFSTFSHAGHCASSLDTAATSAASKQHPQPPPPPMHRYPSWENRIYQVASEGIQDLLEDSSRFRDSKNNNGESGFGSDINVPVYATVKGVIIFMFL